MVTELIYILAGLAFVLSRVVMRFRSIQHTDLGHVALATVAANTATIDVSGAIASAVITALYVTYQWFSDQSAKDVAVYTATYSAVLAAKYGLSVV